MKLEDFYFADKHEAGSRMPIMLPNGEDSGEWLQVRGPDCDESISAGRAYTAAVRAVDNELEALEKACAAKENWAEYNDQRGYRVEDLNRQLAVKLVTGWSFTHEDGTPEPFTTEAFLKLLSKFRELTTQVNDHHIKSRAELNAK